MYLYISRFEEPGVLDTSIYHFDTREVSGVSTREYRDFSFFGRHARQEHIEASTGLRAQVQKRLHSPVMIVSGTVGIRESPRRRGFSFQMNSVDICCVYPGDPARGRLVVEVSIVIEHFVSFARLRRRHVRRAVSNRGWNKRTQGLRYGWVVMADSFVL